VSVPVIESWNSQIIEYAPGSEGATTSPLPPADTSTSTLVSRRVTVWGDPSLFTTESFWPGVAVSSAGLNSNPSSVRSAELSAGVVSLGALVVSVASPVEFAACEVVGAVVGAVESALVSSSELHPLIVRASPPVSSTARVRRSNRVGAKRDGESGICIREACVEPHR